MLYSHEVLLNLNILASFLKMLMSIFSPSPFIHLRKSSFLSPIMKNNTKPGKVRSERPIYPTFSFNTLPSLFWCCSISTFITSKAFIYAFNTLSLCPPIT